MTRMMVAIGAVLVMCGAAAAQSFPTRAVTIIVNSEAGGPADVPIRSMRDELSTLLGQNVVIENRVGAGGQVGAASVARAAPDGYTLVLGSPGAFVIAPHLYPNLGYDPLKDFEPVSLVAEVPVLFAVNIDLPVKTLGEFVAYAKQRPGKLNYSTGGIATPAHLGSEMLKVLAGIDLVHLPHRGTPQALTALLVGDSALFLSGPAAVLPQDAAGKLRLVATTGSQRIKRAPHVPTTAEAGMPDLTVPAWYGIYAPKGTPKAVVKTLDDAIQKALAMKEVRERLEAATYYPIGEGPDAFAAFLKKDYDRWGDIIRKAGIKVQ